MAGLATPAFLVTGASPAMCSVQRSVQDTNAVTYKDIASLIGAIYMHIVLIAKQSVSLPANILLNTPCYYSRTKPPTLFALAKLNCKKLVSWRVVNFCDVGSGYVTSQRFSLTALHYLCTIILYLQTVKKPYCYIYSHLKSRLTTTAFHHSIIFSRS